MTAAFRILHTPRIEYQDKLTNNYVDHGRVCEYIPVNAKVARSSRNLHVFACAQNNIGDSLIAEIAMQDVAGKHTSSYSTN